jgi:hypothetical protein
MAAVEYQNTVGITIFFQPVKLLLTIKALVNPANIIRMLAIATHKVNL